MKRNFYLLAIALIATLSVNASSLYLRFTRFATYTVNIDGAYYQVNGNNVRIPSLRPGRHYLTIEQFNPNRGGRRRPMPLVIYNGPLMVREASDIFASVDNYGFHIDRVIPHRYNDNRRRQYHYRYNEFKNNYEECDGDDSADDYYYDYNSNRNADSRDNRYDDDDYNYNRSRGNQDNSSDRDRRNYNDHYNAPQFMNQRDFEALKRSISDASFESTKRSVAMSGIASNKMSIDQVRQVLVLFSFESTRLEIAKYAYNYCPEKNRFYELTDAFTFDSSKKEIAALSGTR